MEPRVPKILEQEAEAATTLDEAAKSDGSKRSANDPPGGAAAAPKPKLAKLSISLSAPASGSDATAAGAAGAEKASNN
eukprot:COSAG02_NODE_36916_length_449_cov_0.454286_1_plen_78_part_00